jgi:selenide, water dikinase
MGGRPLVALNLAALPAGAEFYDINKRIMQGGIDKMTEAGVSIIGGHTIKDKEPKFGYAVLGSIHPKRILDNTKAKPGDALVLTKPIGTGVISTGIKAGKCSAETAEAFTRSMATLNRRAGELMLEVGVSTATDITGFGLIGHLNEVLSASRVSARLHAQAVPVFGEARTIAGMGMVPAGTRANQKSYDPFVEWSNDVAATDRVLLNDAQTSGGLLIFVPRERKDRLVEALGKENIPAAHIGDVLEGTTQGAKRIFVES